MIVQKLYYNVIREQHLIGVIMKTIAQSYTHQAVTSQNLVFIARNELADLFSNNERSWVEFCDGSVLDLKLGEIRAFKKLQRFHKNGVSW